MAKHSNEFQDSLNSFKIFLSDRYSSKQIKYLLSFIDTKKTIGSGDYFKDYLYENYLKRNEVNYKNDAYMQFFNLFYKNTSEIGGVEITFTVEVFHQQL